MLVSGSAKDSALPYTSQPKAAFWKHCRDSDHFLTDALFAPRHPLKPGDRVATAGSCFAQNIGKFLRASDLELVDVEPAPKAMPAEVAKQFGYGLFSARYGNIYTPRQFHQLLRDAQSLSLHEAAIWERDGVFFDALRPGVEPYGYSDVDQLQTHRIEHLKRVKTIFEDVDLFIFTMGLTETWQHTETGLVFPSVPGLIAGQFDDAVHSFTNIGFAETLEDMRGAILLLQELAPQIRILLTVSPVPLTATATPHHVLRATTYSKSVLRAVAEELTVENPAVDYFPSFEMITGAPFAGQSYASNLRTVTPSAIDMVMGVFFSAYPELALPDMAGTPIETASPEQTDEVDELVCEEALLEAFVKP